LAEGLRRLGNPVEIVRPTHVLPNFAATRVLFNETLRWRDPGARATIGIDADGYAIAGRRNASPHIACIKGVLGDVVRFETGFTRVSMAFQAGLEARHAQNADLVITTSRYCVERIEELYGVPGAIVVPELIDLHRWHELFQANSIEHKEDRFTVLCVCRFYPRKGLTTLLQAAAHLRQTIPELEVRVVGNGPQYRNLRGTCTALGLDAVVHWLGDVSLARLAQEYNRADLFCLPSLQEGFGIVFLEAMAAGKPIVAVRAAAVPEVVRHGILAEPENAESLAAGIMQLYRNPALAHSLASQAREAVESFDVLNVARLFLSKIARVSPVAQAFSLNGITNRHVETTSIEH